MLNLQQFFQFFYSVAFFGVVIAGWVLALCCPRRAYPSFLAILVPVWTAVWWIAFRPESSIDDWGGLSRAIVSLALVVTIGALLLRFVVAMLLERYREEEPDLLDWRILHWSMAATLTASAVLEIGPKVGHWIGGPIALALLFVATAVAWVWSRYKRTGDYIVGLAASVAGTLTLACFLVSIWPLVIVASAERFANGRDYCLLVSDGDIHNRPAENLLDLTPIVMRATENGRHASNRHGYIVLRDSPSGHWSYMQGQFVADSTPTMGDDILNPDNRCSTVPHFARKLPLL